MSSTSHPSPVLSFRTYLSDGSEKELVGTFDELVVEYQRLNSHLSISQTEAVLLRIFPRAREKKAPAPPSSLSFSSLFSGISAVVKQSLGQVVPFEVFSKRSLRCSSCPLRSEVSLCSACNHGAKLRDLLSPLPYARQIPADILKSSCSSCTCSLTLLLAAPKDQLKSKVSSLPSLPPLCWMHDELKEKEVPSSH